MQRLHYNGKIGIFLDHRELFNEACRQHTTTNTTIYKLKPELFDFRPKECYSNLNSQNANHSSGSSSNNTSKRKRKRKAAGSALLEHELLEDQRLIELSTGLTAQLKRPDFVTQMTPLTRYWEETHYNDFPTFHGANDAATFQTFQYGLQNYVIPPHCRFYNANVLELTKLLPQLNDTFDFIVLDPPWRNKYIQRIKQVRAQLAYPMLEDSQLCELPIAQLIHHNTLVAIWCTNSQQHQDALCNEFMPAWNLRLVHSLKWLKLNTMLQPINPINARGQKQPYEMLFLACHRASNIDFASSIRHVELLLSVPSIVHSHKPPLLAWLQPYMMTEQPKCMEIFARYLQPGYTAIGLEVLKLMDKRLYDIQEE